MPTTIYGDLSLDGIVDLRDSIILNKYLAKIIPQLSAPQKLAANCHMVGDGAFDVNEHDASTLVDFIILNIKSLPVTAE
ncbi:MAG: hypothetical protein Q4D37_01505 [Oscillospiraceae bacterium]|nr:hypothetical protein [Oscillospiraceae bacterium]